MKYFLKIVLQTVSFLLFFFFSIGVDSDRNTPCTRQLPCAARYDLPRGFTANYDELCPCPESTNCSGDWSQADPDRVIVWNQNSPNNPNPTIIRWRFCSAVRPSNRSNTCRGSSKAVKLSSTGSPDEDMASLERYQCPCENSNDPLQLRLQWRKANKNYKVFICPESQRVCHRNRRTRCFAISFDANRQANVTKHKCKCPSGSQCEDDLNDPDYGFCKPN